MQKKKLWVIYDYYNFREGVILSFCQVFDYHIWGITAKNVCVSCWWIFTPSYQYLQSSLHISRALVTHLGDVCPWCDRLHYLLLFNLKKNKKKSKLGQMMDATTLYWRWLLHTAVPAAESQHREAGVQIHPSPDKSLGKTKPNPNIKNLIPLKGEEHSVTSLRSWRRARCCLRFLISQLLLFPSRPQTVENYRLTSANKKC